MCWEIKTAVCEFPKIRITNNLYWPHDFYNFLTTLKINFHTTPHSWKYSYSMMSASKPMCSQFEEAGMLSTETREEQVSLLFCILFVRLFQVGVHLLMILKSLTIIPSLNKNDAFQTWIVAFLSQRRISKDAHVWSINLKTDRTAPHPDYCITASQVFWPQASCASGWGQTYCSTASLKVSTAPLHLPLLYFVLRLWENRTTVAKLAENNNYSFSHNVYYTFLSYNF